MTKTLVKLGLAAGLFALAAAPASAEPYKLRVSYDTIPTHLAPIMFRMPGVMKYYGKDYTIDFVRFKGSSLVLQALAANQVDLGVLAFSTFATGIVNANQPIVGVADVAQDGPSFSTVYAVTKDSPIKTVKDLKGATIGVNAFGGAVDMAARGVLVENGLTPDKDVRLIEASFGAMEAMTKANKIQVGAFLAPFWAKVLKDGAGFRPIFQQKDAMGTTQFLLFCAREDFIKAHRDVVVKFLADYVHGIGIVQDPKNREQVLKIMSDLTNRPPAAFADWALLPGKDFYHDPHGAVNVKALQSNVESLVKLKMLSKSFDVSKHVDNSLVQDAMKGM